jgi:histidinol-phosphate aminotransferase
MVTTREVPVYVPGRVDTVTLSTNELAGGPLSVAAEVVQDSAWSIHRYPDTTATALTESIARHHDVTADSVVVGAGAAGVLHRLGRMAAPEASDLVMFGWPGFEAYPVLLAAGGNGQQRIPLTYDHRLDLDAMLAATSSATRMVVLCNPNNPTGTTVADHDLEHFIAELPREVVLVLDEAYHGFDDGPDALDGVDVARRAWAAGRENVIVVRSFSKAYGLAGLRVGYGIAAPTLAARLRRTGLPFEVSSPAQAAATAALEDRSEMVRRSRQVASDRAHLANVLTSAGYPVADSRANFLWLPLGAAAASFAAHCRDGGVAVLAYPDGVRVSIGTLNDNAVFARVAEAYTQSHPEVKCRKRQEITIAGNDPLGMIG